MSAVSLPLRECHHCGTRFEPRHADDQYCCSGCAFVREMIEGEGFSDFYRLLGKKTLLPLSDLASSQPSLNWIETKDLESRGEVTAKVGNLSCTACVWLIERVFHRQPGALRIAVDTGRSILTLWWEPEKFSLVKFAKEMHRFGYPLSEYIADPDDDLAFAESKALLTRLGVTAGLTLNTMAFTLPAYLGLQFENELAGLFRLVAFASATLALLVGGSVFFQRALASFRVRAIHMDVPISLGLIVAYFGSIAGYLLKTESLLYFDFVATFVTLMLLGRWLHIRLIEKNRQQLRARERQVLSITREGESIEPIDIDVEDTITIAADSIVPVKGTLLDAEKIKVTLDWINGEPDPVDFQQGKEIPAGARNASGQSFSIIAREPFEGSIVEKLLATPPPPSSIASIAHPKILQTYLVLVLLIAAAGGVGWFVATSDIAISLQVLMSVLVVSCPCALGLALPLLDEFVNARMRRQGIFVRNNQLWQKLTGIRNLIFDKTGTLTEPVPKLLNAEILDKLDSSAVDALYQLARANSHPHAAAIREALIHHSANAKDKQVAAAIMETPSCGVSVQSAGIEWKFGKASWAAPGYRDPAASVLSRNGETIATFAIGEAVRPGAKEELDALQAKGYEIQILSGDPDRERVVETGRQLGVSACSIFSSQSPEQKAAHILDNIPAQTLFVGDGGNDSLALDSACCTGSPATGIRAIEGKTDFVFMGRNFRAIRKLFAIASRRRHVARSIFLFAVFYNLIAIAICLCGWMNPLLAAILMPISSIISISIAARV